VCSEGDRKEIPNTSYFVPSAKGPGATIVGGRSGKGSFDDDAGGVHDDARQSVHDPFPTTSEGSIACHSNIKEVVRRRVSTKSGEGYRPIMPRGDTCKVSNKFKFLSWNVANISQGEFEVFLHEFEEF
jgi:hypothetical protein